MHKIAKKMYISMLSVILICTTMFATTYAWIGMLSNSTFDSFDIGIFNSKDEAPKEYSVILSTSGLEGSFGPQVDITEIKRSILKNMGYDVQYKSANFVDNLFSAVKLDQATVKKEEYVKNGVTYQKEDFEVFKDSDGNRGFFIDMNNKVTKNVFTFDLYVSVEKLFTTEDDSSNYFLDIYLQGNLFSSRKNQTTKINDFVYPSDFINPLVNGLKAGDIVSGDISVKPESACRLAIQKYESVELGKPEQYISRTNVKKTIIYNGGTTYPSYEIDSKGDKIYSFGGILEDKYNLALQDWNSMHTDNYKTVPQWAINRGDIDYDYTGFNQIISQEDKVGIKSMIKITFSFWFEGWDSDCFSVIDDNPVSLSINFTTKEIDKDNQ